MKVKTGESPLGVDRALAQIEVAQEGKQRERDYDYRGSHGLRRFEAAEREAIVDQYRRGHRIVREHDHRAELGKRSRPRHYRARNDRSACEWQRDAEKRRPWSAPERTRHVFESRINGPKAIARRVDEERRAHENHRDNDSWRRPGEMYSNQRESVAHEKSPTDDK